MQNQNKLIPLIIGVTITLIMCATVLVPVIADQEEQVTTTYSNNIGTHNLLTYEKNAGNHTISYVKDATTYTVDGISFPITSVGDFVVIADTVSIFIQNNNGANVTLINTDLSTRISGNYAINATISEGKLTGTVGTSAINSDCHGLFIAKQSGEYFTTSGTTQNIYVNDNKQITTLYNHVFIRDGVAKYDGAAAGLVAPLTKVKDDVYTLNTGSVKVNDGSNHAANTFVAPVEVTGTNATQAKMVSLINVAPILIIVAVLTGVVAVVVRKQ